VRYDPLKPDRVVLARDDLPGCGPQFRTDASLTALCFVVCVALFLCARHFRPRTPAVETATEPGDLSRGGGVALGAATAAIGSLIVGLALQAQIRAPAALSPGDLAAYPAGAMFILCGIILGLPSHQSRSRGILVALLMTCFAITLDWIAFGPGPRSFGGGLSLGLVSLGFQPGELFGRIVFGVFAVLLNLFTVFAWLALRSRSATKNQPNAQ
jgi:hypothetical protein